MDFTTNICVPKDKTNTTAAISVASMKTPKWLLNLQDGEMTAKLQSDETASTMTELPSGDGHKRMLLFFHTNFSELHNRLDCPTQSFIAHVA